MKILKKRFFALVFFAVLVSYGTAFADAMQDTEMSEEMTGMGTNMVPFHVAEILIAIAVAVLVTKVINETGQKDIFIYIPIGMVFFVIGSIIGYSPHLGWLHDHKAELYEVTSNTIGMAFMGVSFYKWKKMLG